MTISKQFMEKNIESECAVGMNCYSSKWHDMYKHLVSFGEDYIIAGDYKSFDKSMACLLIRVAFMVLDAFRSNVSTADKRIGVGIATDISQPLTNMNGDVVQFFGGNSSGHPLTIIINSIVNSLYLRIAYQKIGFPLETFRANVHPMIVGDDNIMGSNPNNKTEEGLTFNHTTLQRALHSLGVTYTMADKESASVPFINIQDADFLKRTFRFLPEYPDRAVAPLDLTSIFKSLCMYTDGGNISHEQQLSESYLSARREWSLHGREVFDKMCSGMEEIFAHQPEVRRFYEGRRQYGMDYHATLKWVLEPHTSEDTDD
jgi:hypothetical protein